MTDKKRVLVLLDGSAFSLQILSSVKDFLSPEQNRLILLRVEPDARGMVAGPAQPAAAIGSYVPMYASHRDARLARHPIYATQESESQTAMVRSSLQKVIRSLEDDGYEVDLAVRFGEPAEEIVNYIESTAVDLVAMTTHGRTGLQRLLFGSVAAELIRRLNVPILLLRPFATT